MRNHGWLALLVGVISLLALTNSNVSYGQRGNVHWAAGAPFLGDTDTNALSGEAGRNWLEPLNWIEDAVPLEATDIEADHTQIFGTDHVRDPIITTDVGQMGRLLLYSGADLTIEAGGAIETERIWIGQGTDFSNLFGDIHSTLTINGGTLISSSDIQAGVGNEFHPGTLQLNAGVVEARGLFMGFGAVADLSFTNIVDGTMDLEVLSFGPGNPKVDFSGTGSITVDNTFDPPWAPGDIFDGVAEATAAIQAGLITAFGGTGVVEMDTTSIPGRFILSAAQPVLPGDFDDDGNVDGNDLLEWQRNGLSASDLADWQANYGAGSLLSASVAAIPEPGSAALFFLATITSAVALGRRRVA